MKKILAALLVIILILAVGFFWLNNYIYQEKQADVDTSPAWKNISYVIDGDSITLGDGYAEEENIHGSDSTKSTRYFGNELFTDLNSDGREDVVFLLTQENGGSGVFFYVVAALNTTDGYRGSDGYLLGDRVAPQTTEVSQNPRHKNVVVVNYADRNVGDPMTAQPSVSKSVYLKLDIEYMQWGIVVADFEGESI